MPTLREQLIEMINAKQFPPSKRRAFVGDHPVDGVVTHSLNATTIGKPSQSLVRREPTPPKRYRMFSER